MTGVASIITTPVGHLRSSCEWEKAFNDYRLRPALRRVSGAGWAKVADRPDEDFFGWAFSVTLSLRRLIMPKDSVTRNPASCPGRHGGLHRAAGTVDGVWDKVQTIATSTDGAGITTETLTNRSGGTVLLDTKTTITSADGKTITILRDATGGGYISQSEVRTTFADLHRTIVVTDLNADTDTDRTDTSTIAVNGDGKWEDGMNGNQWRTRALAA
jgi:hypothetical protein